MRRPSFSAIEPAILNAFSFESTSWYGPVEQRDLDVHHRETRQHAVRQGLQHALFHRRDVFARHRAALDRVDEFVALARRLRVEPEPHVAMHWPRPPDLLDELAFDLARPAFLIVSR